MVVIDIGSMCCDCGYETFTVFGPRWKEGGGWDDFNCNAIRPEPPPTGCPPGQEWNSLTQQCEEPSPEVCPEGYAWNHDAEECQEVPPPDPVPPEEGTITIKYSFAPEECELVHYDNLLRTEDISLPWEFVHGKITEEEFKEQIDGAFAFWKKVFEDEFPWLTINFVRLGDEPGTVSEHGGAEGYHWVDTDDNNVGDIRFFIADLRREDMTPLATAAMTKFGVESMAADPHKGTNMKDIRFDPRHGWRLDGLDYRGDDTPVENASISSGDTIGDDVAAASGVPFCGFCGCGEEGHGVHSGGEEDHSAHGEYQHHGHSIMLVAAHELGHVFGLQHTGGQGTGPQPDGPELPHDLTSIMNGGISGGVNLLSPGTVPFTINPDGTVGLGGPVPGLGVSGLDEISQVLFDALYKADTVNECIGFVEGYPYDPVAPSPGRWPGYGLRDICEVTVDPSPGDPVFDPENPPSEGLPAPPGIAAQGPLELAQEAEKTKSPAHLLGTVYYDADRRWDSASTQGLYDIHDSLQRSWDHFCPGNPSCRSTLTTWNGEVLYVLSPPQGTTEGAEGKRAAVQRVNLAHEDGPKAVWWSWQEDFADAFDSTPSFKREDLSVPFDMVKGKPEDDMRALGLGRPSGLGWDSSIKMPYGTASPFEGFPAGIQVNPDGEFLNDVSDYEEETTSAGLSFKFDCGYGDDGLGFIVDIPDNVPKIGRYLYPRPAGGDDTGSITTLGLGKVDAAGTETFHPPGDEIKSGWNFPNDTSAGRIDGADSSIMTDLEFCASRGTPEKVIPQIVARNNWKYAAGGYTEVATTAQVKTAEVIVLASMLHGLDGYYQSGFLDELGVDPNDITEGNFTAIGDVVVDWLGDRMGDSPVWSGKSLWGDGAGSEFVPFSAEIIGRTISMAWDFLAPIYMPEEVDGVNVWPECVEGGPDGSYLSYAGDPLGYQFWSPGYAIVGYWKIQRKVGVLKHVQDTHLVTGQIASSSGSFPSVPLTEDKEISSVTYYTKPAGMPFDRDYFIIGRKTQGMWGSGWTLPEEFPWATMGDFPTSIKKEWSYYLPKATGPGDLIDPEETAKLTNYDVVTTSEPTGLPERSKISYYNRTENEDVFVVQVRTETEGVDPAKYFSVTSFPGPHGFPEHGILGRGYSSSFPPHYFESETYGEDPEAAGGTDWDESPPQADSNIPAGSPFSASECNSRGANLNTYERWSSGGGWFLPFSGSVPEIDVNAAVTTQNLGLYSRTQLWFGGHIVFDTMKTYGEFTQATDDGDPVTNWKVNTTKGLVPGETVYVPERGYPRTELEAIEVLPGDRIAVLTRQTQRKNNDTLEHSPQTLTVIGTEGVEWDRTAVGGWTSSLTESAKIVTSSDRWVHIIGFPLNVASVVFDHIRGDDIGDSSVANNWLISLEDGISEESPAVPARIDEGLDIALIGKGHSTDNASWASLWDHSVGDDSNFDAPRNSDIIDDDSKLPGKDVMHPDKFF